MGNKNPPKLRISSRAQFDVLMNSVFHMAHDATVTVKINPDGSDLIAEVVRTANPA